jgi:hypothetical protein
MLSHVSNEAISSSAVHMLGMLRGTSGTFLFNSKQVLEKYWHALFKVASANFRVTPGSRTLIFNPVSTLLQIKPPATSPQNCVISQQNIQVFCSFKNLNVID